MGVGVDVVVGVGVRVGVGVDVGVGVVGLGWWGEVGVGPPTAPHMPTIMCGVMCGLGARLAGVDLILCVCVCACV